MILLTSFFITCYVTFMDNSNELFQQRFCYSQVSAGRATMLTYISAAVLSAPLGLLINKKGKRRHFILCGICTFFLGHLIILAYPQCSSGDSTGINSAVFGLIFIGAGYCFYANCLVPSIALVVEAKLLGTAFGIMQMVESISLAIFPLVSGEIVEHSANFPQGYKMVSWFYLGIAATGVLVSLKLFCVKPEIKKRLDSPNTDSL